MKRVAGALLRRAKKNQLLRRALIPVLLRFPVIVLTARRVRARLQRPRADIHLPVWPGPLPAAYLDLPASSRQALLDLASAIKPPAPPRS